MPTSRCQFLPTGRAGLSAGATRSALAVVATLTTLALAGTATATPGAPAAQAAAKSAAKPAATKARLKSPTPRRQLKNEASGLALAERTAEIISQSQLDVAARVMTGVVDCEFNQRISVLAVDGEPGWFTINHLGKRYRMLPRETATGAVRLEDPAAGVVWLQIPTKSMLMNARIGQRLVDSCLHAEQRAALSAVASAADSLGIVARPETTVVAAPAAVADAPAEPVPSAAGAPALAASAASAVPVAAAASAASVASAASAASAVPAATAASAVPAAAAASAAPAAPAALSSTAGLAAAAAPAEASASTPASR